MIGHMLVGDRIGRHHHLRIEAENVLHRRGRVGKVGDVAIDLVHDLSTREAWSFAGNRFFRGGLSAFSSRMKVRKGPTRHWLNTNPLA